jgi:hypothetical protein
MWYHPFLWVHINGMAPRVGWSTQALVTALQHDHPTLYAWLHAATVSKWISKNDQCHWSTRMSENVKQHSSLAGTGWTGILISHPDVVEEIKMKLLSLQTSGITITQLLAHSIIIAVINAHVPHLLKNFKCSEVCKINAFLTQSLILLL